MDRVVAWLSQTDEGDPAQDDIPAQDDRPQALDRKRKFSDMSQASDDRLQEQKRKHYRPIVPAPNSTLSAFDDGELDPDEDVGQRHPSTLSSNLARTLSISTASAAVASTKQKRVLLAQSTPNFRFLGVSGRGGLNFRQNIDNWVPPGIRQLVRSLNRGRSDRWVICSCLKSVLSQDNDLDPLEDGVFKACSCSEERRLSHQLEARRVIELVVPCKRYAGRSHGGSYLGSPFRFSIANDTDDSAPLLSRIIKKFGRYELPVSLKNRTSMPVLTFEVKSLNGSSLEAENQATICANSILQSWRCLGPSSAYSKTSDCEIDYPTMASLNKDVQVKPMMPTSNEMSTDNIPTPTSAQPALAAGPVRIDHTFEIHINAYI
ncbi:hypothetical protein TWF281_004592 [Arthrobotrys megalospora]